ncbi:TetR/AcrR family transcriptional regulator [Microbacterium sp. Root61]|uniref:TetR/AcrR family transcriptional regulator n=1 Tax=Microbacterium sp. Root61 TaxID=1736570 RepID=UPI00138F062E|nr:TetR/AcrR family transcriptional regulator [Microbacterium sp. Root61]
MTTAKKPRGPYAAADAMRRAILVAATDVFAESGYRAGSIKTIAERVGITDAGVLHHFGNKSALLAAVLEWRDERISPLLPEPGDSGIATFAGLLRVAEYIPTEPGIARLHCTLLAESTDPSHPAHDFFVERYDRTRGELLHAFHQAAGEGHLKAGVAPELAAAATLALMDGLQLQWLLHPDAVNIRETLAGHFLALVDMPDMPQMA